MFKQFTLASGMQVRDHTHTHIQRDVPLSLCVPVSFLWLVGLSVCLAMPIPVSALNYPLAGKIL